MWELRECLEFDPFEGDFGEQGDKTFSDKLVKGRKTHSCFHCDKTIAIGEIHRSRVDVSGGELLTFRWCNECSELMAKIMHYESGGDDDLEIRDELEIQWEDRKGLPPEEKLIRQHLK